MSVRYPFSLGAPVFAEEFFGRQRETARILSLLQARSAVNFYSLRRMGKSSLLLQICHLCKQDEHWQQFHPIFLDLQLIDKQTPLVDFLLLQLDLKTNRRSSGGDRWSKIRRYMEEVAGDPILLLDEVDHWLKNAKSVDDLGPLRSLQQSGALNIVASTVYGAILDRAEIDVLGSPFFNIFASLRLPAFLPSEAEGLLVTLCERGGVSLNTDLAAELARYVGYYPNLVQEIGAVAFNRFTARRPASAVEIISEWRESTGYKWIRLLMRPFQEQFERTVAGLAGVERNSYLTESLADYGVLLRNSDGGLEVAPYVRDLLQGEDSAERLLDRLQSIADLDNSFRLKSKTMMPTEVSSIGQIYIQKGEITMGDSYKAGQAGAMGPHAQARDISFSQIRNQLSGPIDNVQLAAELSRLREQMKKEAVDPEHDMAVGDVAKAEIAAKAGETSKSIEHLKAAGKWALEVATKIGTSLAVEVMKSALRLPHG